MILGIDVSGNNGGIDWSTVAQSPVAFAFIKATEGADFVDKTLATNLSGARQSGIKVGLYHFARWDNRPPSEAYREADHFLETAKKHKHAGPFALDFEGIDGEKSKGAEYMRGWVVAFCNRFENESGCKPILYTNPDYIARFRLDKAHDGRLWIAHVNAVKPRLPVDVSWDLWQFSWRFPVAGVTGFVDANWCRDNVFSEVFNV